MQRSGTHRAGFLSLDQLETDLRVARRFPLQLARRYHALPVAEDDGCVTVAMADPEDQAARAAIQTALGFASFLVRMDCSAVDALIDAAWRSTEQNSLEMLVYATSSPRLEKFAHYARQISELLQAGLHWSDRVEVGPALEAEARSNQYDLLLFDSIEHPALHRLLVKPGVREIQDQQPVPAAGRAPCATLIAQKPRWPIQRILLIISGEEEDDAAVHWLLRMAGASDSTVTALAVVPPAPAMYGHRSALAQAVPTLLSANTAMGRRMRQTARLLVEREIEGTLRLRQGAPDWQIRRELADQEYDLVVFGTRPRRQWLRWLEGDILFTLLSCSRQPVLLALPAGS